MEERRKESKLAELWCEAKESSRINIGTLVAAPVIFLGYLTAHAYETIKNCLYSKIIR